MDTLHLKSPRGWINDPNGFIYYRGEYHLFYQRFPYAARWGRMHWGHAVSRDLVHWEHKDIALFPTKKHDRSGCFSGSAVEHNGRLHLFYTGADYTTENPENVNTCLDDIFTASQLSLISENGVDFDNFNAKFTVIPPIEDETAGSKNHTRDPKVWRGKNSWYMILGSTVNQSGRFLFYKSRDLVNWEYLNYSEKQGVGWMWECPDYFKVNAQGVAVFSPMGVLQEPHYSAVTVCTFADFCEETGEMQISGKLQLFDYGEDLYAPQSNLDKDGNRVVIAWARMPEPFDKNRIGMFSIPRVCEVKNGRIYFRPHPNADRLFTRKITSPNEAENGVYKISADMKNGDKINIGGYVLSRENNRLTADRTNVFAGHTEIKCVFRTPEIHDGNHLDIFVDPNLIEVFVNGGEYVLTNVVYGLTNEIKAQNCTLCTVSERLSE